MFACRLLCSGDSDRNQLSEVVKPGDLEDKLKKRDDAFNKAIKTVSTEVQVKNELVGLAQKLEKAVRIELREWSLMLGTSRNLKEFYHPSTEQMANYRMHTTPDGIVTKVEVEKKVKGKNVWVELNPTVGK